MFGPHRSLFDLKSTSIQDLQAFFNLSKEVKNCLSENGRLEPMLKKPGKDMLVALFFLEPSTRTRLSFEIAAKRLGLQTLLFDNPNSSSVAKGETNVDTFLTIKSLKPELFVVRHPEDPALAEALKASETPVINGGQGALGHPTQALIDVFTAQERLGNLEGKKILFVGDVKFGRAARSSMDLFAKIGVDVGVVSPPEMAYSGELPVTSFDDLKSAASWADIVMGLRIQKERHEKSLEFSVGDYVRKFRLDSQNLAGLKPDGLIMHPGPFVPDVDFVSDLLKDDRCAVHDQVENGVYIRAALMGTVLELWSREWLN